MQWLRTISQSPARPCLADMAVAGGLLVWAVLEAIELLGPGPVGARVAYAVLISAPLALRRGAPLAVTIFIVAVTVAWGAEKGHVADHGTMPYPVLLVATFSTARYARNELAGAAGGVLLAAAALFLLTVNWFQGRTTPMRAASWWLACESRSGRSHVRACRSRRAGRHAAWASSTVRCR